MRPAVSTESTTGWATATLRWLWGADDDVGLRELFTSTPATWFLLAIFSVVSISDVVLAGSLTESGPVIERLGNNPALMARGQWWRFVTTTLINAPELPTNALQHLLGNAVPFVIVAPRVERAVGSLRAVVLFVVTTICGAVALYVGVPFGWGPGGGTSNAVYGFIGATLVTAYVRRRWSTRDAIFFGAALFAVVTLALDATAASTGTNVSHLGGFIAGSVITTVWCRRPAARSAGTAIVVAFIVIAASVAGARTLDVRRSDLDVRAATPLGFAPVMITPGFGSLWATGGRATGEVERDEVVRIDETSGRVSARIRELGIGGLPVVTNDRVWVAANADVVAIDPTSNRIVSRIRLSGGALPWSLAATEDALWAAVPDSGEVIRIDLRTREQKPIAVGARAFVVTAHGSNVWATSYGGQTVSRLDPRTGLVLEQTQLPNPVYHAVFLDGSLWVGAQPFIYRLHPRSLDVIAKIDVGRETWTLASDRRGMLLVPQRYLRTIVEVDPETNTVERRVVVGLRQPTSVAAIGDDLWIADPFGRSILRTSRLDDIARR